MHDSRRAALSYVVVSFHRPESLERILREVRADDVEVIVANVENDHRVATLAGGDALRLDENLGYGAAVNAAVALATSEVVIFSNDDITVSANDLRALAASLRRHGADVVVPRIVTAEGVAERTVMALPSPAALLIEWALLPDLPIPWLQRFVTVQKWRAPAKPEVIQAASAVLVATWRSLLLEVPIPDAYFLYWEESEWFTSLRRRGLRTVLDPTITVGHGQGRTDVRPAKSVLMARNAVRCVRRSRGRTAAALAWPAVVLWNTRLAALAALRRRDLLAARRAGLKAALGAWKEI